MVKSEVNTKARSCKGCLYYSLNLKADSRDPLCIGVASSVDDSNVYEYKEDGRRLGQFKYGCIGYSRYNFDQKDGDDDSQTKLPVCFGLEILDSGPSTHSAHSPHNKQQDGKELPPTPPTDLYGEELVNSYIRNANLDANGVEKNKLLRGRSSWFRFRQVYVGHRKQE